MQPENSHNTPQGVENLPMPPSIGPESIPSLPPLETGLERGQERSEQVAEAGARVSDAAASAMVAAAPAAPALAPGGTASSQQATPLVAADEDLIEKEWVDKAKEVIGQTKDDPHARSAKVSELQRDYLQKRYGKVIGTS